MNSRQLIRSILLIVVFGSLGVFAWQRSQTSASNPPVAVQAAPAPVVDAAAKADVVATYFTTNVRCESCRTIEALSQRAVVEGFPTEVAAGKVVFRVINTDLPEHAHYVDHYEITNKIVIVSHQRDGKEVEWKGLQDVWLHFHEPDTFLTYVREPIRAFLAGK